MVWRRHRTPLEHATVAEYRDFVQTRADRIASAVAATDFGAPTSTHELETLLEDERNAAGRNFADFGARPLDCEYAAISEWWLRVDTLQAAVGAAHSAADVEHELTELTSGAPHLFDECLRMLGPDASVDDF